ncbi:MAG: hypothetical protein ACO1OQ_08485 [Rufibacter sp.]
MAFQDQQRERYIKQLVSNARAIISNQVGLPLGVLKMNKYITWIDYIRPLENIDLEIFSTYYINIDEVPIGTERLEWNIEKLIEFEEEFDHNNKLFRADVLRKCRELIDKLGKEINEEE